ncbi:MAG: hypothetical protein J7578_04690 [Chitinophagaceae bacterium]|nr:hypothetical protein [Chitinophagaceae bacterium]
MKQLLVFILAFLYLASSAGATVHLHYCKGKLVDIQVGDHDKKPCNGCASKKENKCKKPCCKDEHRMVKLEKDHQKSAEGQFHFVQPVATIAAPFFEIASVYFLNDEAELPFSHAPPLIHPIQLHLLHCNFRV